MAVYNLKIALTDGRTSTALSNAQVQLTKGGTLVDLKTTGSDGIVTFRVDPVTRYSVACSHAGYVSWTRDADIQTSNLDLFVQLFKTSDNRTIALTIVDADTGEKVPGVAARLDAVPMKPGAPVTATTNSEGQVTLSVETGLYDLTLSSPTYKTLALRVDAAPGDVTETLEMSTKSGMYNLTVKVSNAEGEGVTGATIYVSGDNTAGTFTTGRDLANEPIADLSRSLDSVNIPLKAGTYEVSVKAEGYADKTQTVELNKNLTQEFHLTARTSEDDEVEVNLSFDPAVGGVTWTLVDGDEEEVASGTSSGEGKAELAAGGSLVLAVSSYQITANLTGYEQTQQWIDVGGQKDFVIQLVKTATANPAETPEVALGNLSEAMASATLELGNQEQSEYIYPNDAFNKYYTATQARIYVGNLFIDELDTLQYVLQENTVPVFGYASRYADAYGTGRSLVQGQLVLNFVTEGYLYTVLQEYAKMHASTTSPAQPDQETQTLLANRELYLQAPKTPRNLDLLDQINRKLDDIYGTSSPAAVKAAKRFFQMKRALPLQGYDNAVYQPVLFDLELQLGEGQEKKVRRLEKVKLISNEQVYDQSGQVLRDVYGFMARRLR
jgi:hypothetical protein